MIVGPLTWNPLDGCPWKRRVLENDFEGELGSSESFSTILGLSSIILLFILMDTPRSGHHCRPCHTLAIIGTRLVPLLVAPLRVAAECPPKKNSDVAEVEADSEPLGDREVPSNA